MHCISTTIAALHSLPPSSLANIPGSSHCEIHALLLNRWNDRLRKKTGSPVCFLSPSPQISNPRLEARGTTLFLPPLVIIFGGHPDEKKHVKAPGETFHLPQRRRYSGMAAASAATPPVLLSFSCSVSTEWGRGGVRVAVRG